jgi:hypothetical protein
MFIPQRNLMRLIVISCVFSLFVLSGCRPTAQATEDVKEQMIEQWKQDFKQLKSMKLSAKVYKISTDGKEKHLFVEGSFVYDAPMFLDDIILAGKQNANSKRAYDGKYFYAYTSGKAFAHLRPADHPQSALIRAMKADLSRPVNTLNPLYDIFEFALPDGDNTFSALSKPETWDNLKNRIVGFKSNPDGSYLFRYRRKLQPDGSQPGYAVTVVSKNGVFVPASINETQPPQDVINVIKVVEYSAVDKSAFPLPIPLKLSVQPITNGVSHGQTETVIDKKSLQVNSSIDKRIFTLHPKNPTELIDVKILE